MARKTINLGAFTGTTTGATMDVPDYNLHGLSLYVFGTFVGTLVIEMSPDGTNWIAGKDFNGASLGGITTPGMFSLAGTAFAIRARCSAFTSGTINAAIIA